VHNEIAILRLPPKYSAARWSMPTPRARRVHALAEQRLAEES